MRTSEEAMTLDIRTLPGEAYLVGTAEDVSAAPEIFDRAARALAEHGVEPMSVKAYGPRAAMAEASRALAVPATFLESRSVGLQIWAVQGEVASAAGGRLWNGGDFRVLHVPCVRGSGGSAPRQAESMFAKAGELLAAHGFAWRHVARTWIYLARLLDWYGEFNGVRTEVYRRAGLTAFPASTGIQGRTDGEECQMDLLAVDGLPVRLIRTTPRQSEAFAYGSAFSRGAVVGRTIHVSGTASIGADGRTLHVGDPEAQFAETLDNVAALLSAEGARLKDVVSATLFCRDEGVLESCLARRLAPFPFVPVVAHVCRPDLLVEIEAVAAV
ncbi:MAG: hypothetical protein HYY17_07855 [Planctomycetes bacterium]|nr:hypothetical protein [Planctomycetota bacterium]